MTVQAPDAEFADLREAALTTLQETQGEVEPAWSDHNLHDPGITMLEACLFALADLHYRIETRGFDGWPFEIRPWRGAELARGGDRDAVARLFEVDDNVRGVRAIVAGAASRQRAEIDVAAAAFTDASGTAIAISPAAAGAAVRIVREPLLRRALLDRSGPVGHAIGSGTSPGAIRTVVARLVEDLGLWPEEVDALIAATRRRRLVRLLRDRSPEIRRVVDGAVDQATALTDLGEPLDEGPGEELELDADEALIVLGQHPRPPAVPEDWEEEPRGETDLWPPHPVQARTCEPVTSDDYRRLALAAADVKRAWVVPGLARGINWDGTARTQPRPYRQGALTLLIEPDPAVKALKAWSAGVTTADRTFLTGVRDAAIGTESLGTPATRRLLGDEVGTALLSTFGVVVKGMLEIDPSASESFVLQRAVELLQSFLSSDRLSPLEPEPPAAEPLRCPQDLEGPWPSDAAAQRAFAADPGGERGGWTPGDPVRASEVVELLHEVPGVVGVDGLELQRADEAATAWHQELFAPAGWETFSVPTYDRHCLCVRVVDPRECRDA